MNRIAVFEILRRLTENPKWKKKLILLSAIGVFGFLVTGATVVWLGISAINYASNAVQSPVIRQKVESLHSEANKKMTSVMWQSCWNEAQGLMSLAS